MPQVSNVGPVWNVSLSHNEVDTLSAGGGVAALALPPPIDVAVATLVSYIVLIDEIGGGNGVDISGVIGVTGGIVTPNGFGAYGWLVKGAHIVIDAGKNIGEFILKLVASVNPGEIQTVAVLGALATAGLPGAVFITILKDIFGGGPPPPDSPEALNKRGAIKGDRVQIGPWESFVMADIGGGNVALLSWQGYFSAQGGGGSSVYANRPWIGAWEKWTLVRNDDGTVSFRSSNGRYLGTSSFPDHSCFCDQVGNTPGSFTRFRLESLNNGQIALKTIYSRYVSVQPNA